MKHLKFLLVAFLALLVMCAWIVISHAELINREDGTIEDITNNLQWHQSKSPPRMNHTNATTFASITRYGYDDWRLPTLTELLTIILSTSTPQIDSIFEIGLPAAWTYWTSSVPTTEAVEPFRPSLRDRIHVVYFADGTNFIAPTRSHHSARPVRDPSQDVLWVSGDNVLWSGSDVMYWE